MNKEEQTKEKNEKKVSIKKIIKIIWQIISWTIIAILLFIIIRAVAFNKKELFGYNLYIIGSGSMEPEIQVGDAILVKKIKDNEQLNKGDVIAFSENNLIVVHRIVEIKTSDEIKYITKGDNNNIEDNGYRKKEEIKGKMVFKIPKVNDVFEFLRKNIIWFIAIDIGIILIIIIKNYIIKK